MGSRGTRKLYGLLLAGGLGLLGCGDPNVPLTQPPPDAFRVSTPRPPRLDLYPTPSPTPTPTPTPPPSLLELTARIELPPDQIVEFVQKTNLEALVKALQSFGYLYVSLDLEGYRSGKLNRVLNLSQLATS